MFGQEWHQHLANKLSHQYLLNSINDVICQPASRLNNGFGKHGVNLESYAASPQPASMVHVDLEGYVIVQVPAVHS